MGTPEAINEEEANRYAFRDDNGTAESAAPSAGQVISFSSLSYCYYYSFYGCVLWTALNSCQKNRVVIVVTVLYQGKQSSLFLSFYVYFSASKDFP